MDFNHEFLLRYFIELSILIPIAVFSVIPVREYLKFNPRRSFLIAAVSMLAWISGASFFSALWLPKVREVLIPSGALIFTAYFFAFDLSLAKKLFCFFNSLMLCAWSNFFTITLMAPNEIQNIIWYRTRLFTARSALACIGIAFLSGLVFFRTMAKKIPYLLRNERLDVAWKFLFLLPIAITAMLLWMAPLHPPLMIIGRIRPISMALITFMLFALFMFYDIFWRITENLTESAELQQENTLLQMEARRYGEIKNYMNETRTMRHDFRQHIAVLTGLARAGKTGEILSYAEELNDKTGGHVLYCANNAVDAIISHYDSRARAGDIKINWKVKLPENLPIKESDFCAMFGNLIENAMNAVKKLEIKNRHVNVIASMLSEAMLGISVDNPFEGTLKFNRNGLPVSASVGEGHGFGLISVSNIVKRYGGSLDIKTDEKIFRADVILYCRED